MFNAQMKRKEFNMTNQEQQLIDAIKALPGHQVFLGRNGGAVTIAITKPNGVSQQSVWLGRSSTIERLQSIIANSKVDSTLVHMGRAWRVLSVGTQRDGNTFCHLISLHDKIKGQFIQINDWVDSAVLAAAKEA